GSDRARRPFAPGSRRPHNGRRPSGLRRPGRPPVLHRMGTTRRRNHSQRAAQTRLARVSAMNSGIDQSRTPSDRSRDGEEAMGKLIVTEFVTLDGIAQAPGGPDEDRERDFPYGGWQAPYGDEEVGDVLFAQAKSMDALLLGRKTYDIFANFWPNAPKEIPF